MAEEVAWHHRRNTMLYNVVLLFSRDSSRRWRCWLTQRRCPEVAPDMTRPETRPGSKHGRICSVRPVRPGWWGRLGMGLLAENRKATIWETLNESVHHMASMDLKTGNKLEGQRPGQARPRRLLMPMGEREEHVRFVRRWNFFGTMNCNLARKSRLRIENGAGRREGGVEGQIIFRTVDGSHAFPADMSAGPEPTARRRRRYEASSKTGPPAIRSANLPRLRKTRYSKFHRDPTPKRGWVAGLLRGLPSDGPQETLHRQPFRCRFFAGCPEFRRHQHCYIALPSSPNVTPYMYTTYVCRPGIYRAAGARVAVPAALLRCPVKEPRH